MQPDWEGTYEGYIDSDSDSYVLLSALGQNTDVAVQAQNMVNGHGKVPFTHLSTHPQTQRVCTPLQGHPNTVVCGNRTVNVNGPSQTDQIIPTVSNIKIVSSTPVTLGHLVPTSLPDEPTVDVQEFINCGSVTTQQAISLAVSFQRSTSLAVSQSITNSMSTEVGFSAGPPFFKVDGKVTVGNSATSGTVDTQGDQLVVQRTSNVSVSLTKGQGIAAQLEVFPVTFSQTFQSSVTIDGDLSPNDTFKHLSDMFPDPKVRTFPVEGTISVTDGSDGKTTTFDDPTLTCPTGQDGIIQTRGVADLADHVLVTRQQQ